ncbi:hypothetical protein ABZ348_01215 [Streptomyces sp. NPDC005963]|uniref:hypothetical protein n=1 Tax=Streptomyces sp. NPDC005963 TaxID=3156721 RepID=UPI0033EEF4C2
MPPSSTRARTRSALLIAASTAGALMLVPSAFAVPPTPPPAPAATSLQPTSDDVARVAAKHRAPKAEVQRTAGQLAPIIKALTPKTPPTVRKGGTVTAKVAKAPVDECFGSVGGPRPAPGADGSCPSGFLPKRNQAYAHGGVRGGDHVFFGTSANLTCGGPGLLGPYSPGLKTKNLVCEGSQGPSAPLFGGNWGDWRAPHVYRVNADTEKTEDITPTPEQAPGMRSMMGVRGQAYHDDVVLLAGPRLTPAGGVSGLNVLAYEASTGRFIGEKLLPEYSNMRTGVVIRGELYVGARATGGTFGAGGVVLKWTGDKADPFRFEVVAGGLPHEPAYITGHDGRIVTANWSTFRPGQAVGGSPEMFISPALPARGGLTHTHATKWKPIFQLSQYEPDPVIAQAGMFGALTSWRGKLYFSTMYYPTYNTVNAWAYYGKPKTEIGRLNTYVNAERGLQLFEMTDPGKANQKVSLLYGDRTVPVYDTATKTWVHKKNKLNQTPRFGPSGFGNRWNNYSWQMTVFNDQLYLGTGDFSNFLPEHAELMKDPALFGVSDVTAELLKPVVNSVSAVYGGADTWRMTDPNRAATPFNLDGYGNRLAHGVRFWVPFEDKGKLFTGSATFANLANRSRESGGWDLTVLK